VLQDIQMSASVLLYALDALRRARRGWTGKRCGVMRREGDELGEMGQVGRGCDEGC
jgi:hypothetical protein